MSLKEMSWFKPGGFVSMQVVTGAIDKKYKTKISDVAEGTVQVVPFLPDSLSSRMHCFDKLRLHLVHKGNLYVFKVTPEGNYTFRIEGAPDKLNQREAYRVPVVERVVITYNNKKIEGLTVDLSSTGMQFLSSAKLDIKEKYTLEPCEKFHSLRREFELVRVQQTENGKYLCGARFTDELTFCKLVAELQRESLKKGR